MSHIPGTQKTDFDPNNDYGMAQDPSRIRYRYGLSVGDMDEYKGVSFVKTNMHMFRVDEPSELKGSYTSMERLREAVDSQMSTAD